MSKDNIAVSSLDDRLIDEQAAAWAIRLESGDATAQERAEYAQWVSADDRRRHAMEKFSAIWRELGDGRESRFEDGEAPLPPTFFERIGLEPEHGVVAGVAAMFALFISIVVIPYTIGGGDRDLAQTYATEIGSQKVVTLRDGSLVTLNTNSQVEVSYSETSRDITLLRGEAHFLVAHDKERPFSVVAANTLVRAVGTAFAVRIRTDSVNVIVTEGAVDLLKTSQNVDSDTDRSEDLAAPSSASLKMGESIVIRNKLEPVKTIDDAEMSRKLSWRDGVLAFAGEPLAEVLDDVSRYTEMEIIIQDLELSDIPIGGYFKVGNVDSLFEALEDSFEMRIERVSDERVHLYAAY
ncbi:MAG: FecR domain-containing protein [Pseudomonadota bacterium]